jgi:DNA helicase HerA-like ATPase
MPKAKTSTRLRVSPTLTLPLDAVTQSFALLAVRGAGKSNGATVLAEEMYQTGLPWVVIDPKGDYWGLRSSRDGSGPGCRSRCSAASAVTCRWSRKPARSWPSSSSRRTSPACST